MNKYNSYCLMVLGLLIIESTSRRTDGISSGLTFNGNIYQLSNKVQTIEEAIDFCENRQSELAVIDSSDIQKKMLEFVNRSPDAVQKGVWLKMIVRKNITVIVLAEWSYKKCERSFAFKYRGEEIVESEPDGDICVNKTSRSFEKTGEKHNFICQRKVPGRDEINTITNEIISKYSDTEEQLSEIDIKKLASKMDYLLEASQDDFFSENPNTLSKTLSVVEKSIHNYNFKKASLDVTQGNIRVKQETLRNNKLKNELKLHSEADVNATYPVFSEKLIQELQGKESSVLITSIEYLQPKMFSAAEIVDNSQGGIFTPPSYPAVIRSNVLSVGVQSVNVAKLNNPLEVVSQLQLSDRSLSEVDSRFAHIPSVVRITPKEYLDEKREMKYKVVQKCAFWDTNKSTWSSKGVETISNETTPGDVRCHCSHMTHFAVILEISEIYVPVYLSAITLFGCIFSIICLVLTISTNLYFKQLRTKLPQKILTHICFSLLILNFIFILGIDKKENEAECMFSSIIMHYCVLVLWLWLLVEGLFLFRNLVWARLHPGFFNENKFYKIVCSISYALPVVVVGLVALVLGKDGYVSERYCWLKKDPMIYSLMIPIGLILLGNLIIFSLAMYYITCGRKRFKKESARVDFQKSFRRAMCMVASLGLPWIFGYLMLLSVDPRAKTVFSFIFSILNSLQGALIFIFYVVTQENVQELIRDKYKKLKKEYCCPNSSQNQKKKNKDDKPASSWNQTNRTTLAPSAIKTETKSTMVTYSTPQVTVHTPQDRVIVVERLEIEAFPYRSWKPS